MKRIFFGVLLLASASVFAQNDNHNRDRDHHDQDNVPANVRQSYQREHPNTKETHWKNENGQWHVTYRDQDDKNYDVYYDNDGRRMDRGGDADAQLPYKLKRRLDRRYHTSYQAHRMDRPGSDVIFKISLGDGSVMYYDENGRRRNDIDEHRDHDRDRDNH